MPKAQKCLIQSLRLCLCVCFSEAYAVLYNIRKFSLSHIMIMLKPIERKAEKINYFEAQWSEKTQMSGQDGRNLGETMKMMKRNEMRCVVY